APVRVSHLPRRDGKRPGLLAIGQQHSDVLSVEDEPAAGLILARFHFHHAFRVGQTSSDVESLTVGEEADRVSSSSVWRQTQQGKGIGVLPGAFIRKAIGRDQRREAAHGYLLWTSQKERRHLDDAVAKTAGLKRDGERRRALERARRDL